MATLSFLFQRIVMKVNGGGGVLGIEPSALCILGIALPLSYLLSPKEKMFKGSDGYENAWSVSGVSLVRKRRSWLSRFRASWLVWLLSPKLCRGGAGSALPAGGQPVLGLVLQVQQK